MDLTTRKFPAGFTVTKRKKVQLDAYEMGQLLTQIEVNNVKMKSLTCCIEDKNICWVSTYTNSMDEFEERLPIFEQSANSFRVKP